MKKTNRLRANWRYLLTILFIAHSLCSAAQANYWSIFSSSGCSHSNRMQTAVPPSTSIFSGIGSINDPNATPDNPFPLAHSVYNNDGQLLFSVDRNGIFNPDGSPAYDFTAHTSAVTGSSSVVAVKEALSEICTFPCVVNPANRSYYAMFWAASADGSAAFLRVITVNVAGSGTLTFDDHVLSDATGVIQVSTLLDLPCFTIAADEQHCGATHDIYTTEQSHMSSFTGFASTLRKWTFGVDGSLPSASALSFLDQQHILPGLQKAKILRVGATKYYVFAGLDIFEKPSGEQVMNSGFLVCWDITHSPVTGPGGIGDVAIYHPGGSHTNITGFECLYVDASPYLIVNHQTLTTGGGVDDVHSGLVYFTPVNRGSISTSPTALTGTSEYCFSDLELSISRNLFMVKGLPFEDGVLAYLPESSLLTTSPIPSIVMNTCSNVYVGSHTHGTASNPTPFYLGKQFINESINYPAITDITISNRCAPDWPGSTAAHPQYTVATTGGSGSLQYLWTPIPPETMTSPGGPVTIYRNSALLDDYNVYNPSIVALSAYNYHGSTPIINADFVLSVTDDQNCVVTKEVETQLITSGYDLATRDSHFDLFSEPNTQFVNPDDWDVWSSPDIFNRYHGDGLTHAFEHESPDYAATGVTTNYLYVNVRNVGCIDYHQPASDVPMMKTYWTMGGFSSETWPAAWNGSTNTPAGMICDGSTQPLGSNLLPGLPDGVQIPDIPAGGSVLVEIPWTPPNPQDYFPPDCTTGNPYMELCFLSRIVDYHNVTGPTACTPDGMTYCELTTGTETANVVNNNNIATRNTSIAYVDHLPAIRHHVIIAGNGGLTEAPFNIEMVNDAVLHSGSPVSSLSNYVNIKVFLGDLYDVWKNAGSKGTFTKTDDATRTVTFDGSNTVSLENILMKPGQTYPVELEFDLLPGTDGKTMSEETVYFRQIALNRNIDTLTDSITWCHVDTLYDSLMTAYYDTICTTIYDTNYHQQDSVYSSFSFRVKYDVPTKGVLTVTGISNGDKTGCDYAQIMVANCGDNFSSSVDIRGWIIDDNSGNFDLEGCTAYAGVTKSHYRLAYNDIWANVPVGSMLIVYNADSNCYNLPDTFKIDTIGSRLVYWTPLGGSLAGTSGKACMERFKVDLAPSLCTYVTDTATTDSTSDSTYYQVAGDWQNTIALDLYGDAFQVRCPRCDRDVKNEPAFYHGIGYGPTSGSHPFNGIDRTVHDLGGALMPGTGLRSKYNFNGQTGDDLGDPLKWTWSPADMSGSAPSDITSVNSNYLKAIQDGRLGLPCCAKTEAERKANNSNNGGKNVSKPLKSDVINAGGLRIYPVPATMTLTFEYAKEEKVTIQITDITGRVIARQDLTNSSSANFNVAGLTPGVYLYKIISNTLNQSGKVIIE